MYSENDNSSSNQSAAQTDDLFMKDFKLLRQFKDSDLTKPDGGDLKLIVVRELTRDKQNDNLKIKETAHLKRESTLTKWNLYGLRDPAEINCFELTNAPGLFIIPNPFRNGHQRYFVKKCLGDYHNLPNKTNLDAHVSRNADKNLWLEAVNKKDFSEFNKLRWTTIGYHYDWTNKIYNEQDFTPMPEDVVDLSQLIADLIGFVGYRPEAGIVNYYHLNSTLSAHQDYSEKNMNAPLISVSLGNSAIFLVGGQSRAVKPTALYLSSGDVVVMSGQARLAFHGVPKITKEPLLQSVFDYDERSGSLTGDEFKSSGFYVGDEEWAEYYDYIKLNRINLNIRQVN